MGTRDEANPFLGSLLITRCCHDLPAALTSVIDPGNANRSTFTAWASPAGASS